MSSAFYASTEILAVIYFMPTIKVETIYILTGHLYYMNSISQVFQQWCIVIILGMGWKIIWSRWWYNSCNLGCTHFLNFHMSTLFKNSPGKGFLAIIIRADSKWRYPLKKATHWRKEYTIKVFISLILVYKLYLDKLLYPIESIIRQNQVSWIFLYICNFVDHVIYDDRTCVRHS